MGRVYTVEFENITITNANGDVDFFEIRPADDKPCTLHALFLSQHTEIGDAQEEMLRLRIIRGHTTSGTGGTTGVTPRPLNPSDAVAGFACDTNHTTVATVGSPVNLHSEAFNVRTGLQLVWTPPMRPKVSQGQTTLVVRLMEAVTDDVDFSGTLYIEEEG